MTYRNYAFTFLLLSSFAFCSADTPQTAVIEISQDFQLYSEKPKNELQFDALCSAYIQGMLDNAFPQTETRVRVEHGQVLLKGLPQDSQQQKKIVSFIENIVAKQQPKPENRKQQVVGMWFPESTILYPVQVANPLHVCFGGGIRFGDRIAGKVCTPVTFGDQLPLYRWNNVSLGDTVGDMQLEIEGAVFAVFDQTHYSSPLINADYYVGIPLSYATGRWAHRVRIYHISSHLGDEYMNRRHHAKRKNKSFEAIDFFTSYNLTSQIRLYGGIGAIPHSDSEMPLKPLYAEYGIEVRAGRKEWQELYGTPYLAMHFENWQECKYRLEANYAIGYEWGKLSGLGRKFRVSLEYHTGHSCEGQFSDMRSDYLQARISYGF